MAWRLELECGHSQNRKAIGGTIPVGVICVDCPAAGGLGGTLFAKVHGNG